MSEKNRKQIDQHFGGVYVLAAVAIYMLIDLWDSSRPVWTVFLVFIVGGLLVAAALLWRFILRHGHEIGEARLIKRSKSERNG